MVKKDSLIKGTIILAAAALVARFLGIFQRVPLDHMLSDAGSSYFTLSNNLYLILLIVATGGIPSTISKMVSERYAQGKPAEAKHIYRAALWFGAVTGVAISAVLYFGAPMIAQLAKSPGAETAYRAIAPTLLVFPIIAMMRGYFQGRQFMTAGGVSQIVEQILRVVTSVGLVYLLLIWDYEHDEWLAAAAAFGSVLGGVGALFVMMWYGARLRKHDAAEAELAAAGAGRGAGAGQPLPSFRAIYAEIFRMSIPIVLTAMTVQLMYYIDTQFFYRLTRDYYDRAGGEAVLADLGMKAQAIAGIPPILAIALSQSIIPVISSAYAVRNVGEVERQSSLVMRIVVLTGVPAALALTVASVSVTDFLFERGGEGVVAALTAGTIFQISMMTTNSLLFGMGKPYPAMRHTLIGMGLKVAASLALAPVLGVYGLIIASTLCFITVTMQNLYTIRRDVRLSVLGGRWSAYLAAIAVTAAAGWGLDTAGRAALLPLLPDRLAYFATAAATGIAVLALYLVLLVLLRVVTRAEAQSYPAPLRKLFGPLLRVLGR